MLGAIGVVAEVGFVGWTYLSFDGGNDQLFEFGGQLRHPFARSTDGTGGIWVGGEGTFSILRTSIDNGGSATNNGWSATALLGMPVGQSRWGVNLYVGGGISNYGATGKNIRAGVDLQPWFLRRGANP